MGSCKFLNNLPLGAVIFDMDGVLVDNKQYHDLAWKHYAQKYCTRQNFDFDGWVQDMAGRTTTDILKSLLLRDVSAQEIAHCEAEKETMYRNLYSGKLTPLDGLLGFLAHLQEKSIPCAIATSGPIENIEFVLSEGRIDAKFAAIVHAGMITNGKPHPEIYLRAAELLSVSPSTCVVFEDSRAGVQSGCAAGMTVIGVSTSLSDEALRTAGAVHTVANFTDCHNDIE